MHPRAKEFESQARESYGVEVEPEEFPEGTKTAAAAAEAVGCSVGQIASSLVFETDGRLVVVVTSGANRVSEDALADYLGVDADVVGMADADDVRETVGWAIGGVPPFCHETDLRVVFDPSLDAYETVWAAAGTPSAVFPIAPEDLKRHADAETADVMRPR